MLNVQTTAGDGDVDVWVLTELAAIGVKGTEDANLSALLTGPPQHGPGGAAKQFIEQGPVVVKERPEQMGHRKGDVLPFAVRENVLLLSNPLFSGLHATGTAGL